MCQHPHQPVTLRFPYPEYDTKSINKNSKNSQSGPKSRQTTEPEDKKLIKLIPNEIINAHLRKKLDTEPIESIKVNFRLSTSQSKKKYQRVLNTKRDIEEEGEREKEREK